MWFASIIGDLVGAVIEALSGEPDLDAFKQACLNAERKVSDELAKKEIGE
jgi:hypothetical protein